MIYVMLKRALDGKIYQESMIRPHGLRADRARLGNLKHILQKQLISDFRYMVP